MKKLLAFSFFSLEPIRKLFTMQNRPFEPPCRRRDSPTFSSIFLSRQPALVYQPWQGILKIIGFSKAWSFAIGSLIATDLAAGESHAWSVWGEYAYYGRDGVQKITLVEDANVQFEDSCGNCNNSRPCNSRDLVRKFDFEPGIKGGVSYSTRKETFEASYLWLQQWQGSCHASDAGGLYLSQENSTDFTDYTAADSAKAVYQSAFQNGELNYHYHMTPKGGDYFACSWLLGLRYLDLHEHLKLAYTAGDNTSHYKVRTTNYMAALQGGGAVQWNPTLHLSWELVAKVGVAYNWAKQKLWVGDDNDTVVLYNQWASKQQCPPLIVDTALTLGYQWLRSLNVHVGYQVIYINGVALAPNQVVKATGQSSSIEVNGAPLIYGVFGGLTFNW